MSRVTLDSLVEWSADAFATAGLTRDEGLVVARNLAYAEARGVSGHGFVRLGIYLERIRNGGINAAPAATVVRDTGAMVVIDADGGAGQVSAVAATELAIERALVHGIATVIVRGANHFGAAAFYSEMMADAGLFGITACNTDQAMCAPFGGARVLGTNPIAIALPMDSNDRPILDMATSEVSLGKLVVAAAKGDPIPIGWAVDADRKPTTSAADGMLGALLPSGGPKGFGLAFMIDMLAALGGAQTSPRIAALYGDPTQRQNLGQVFIAIQPGDPADFRARASDLMAAVHASGPGPGGHDALFPGEPELRRREANAGVLDVSAPLARELAAIADSTGVPLPDGVAA